MTMRSRAPSRLLKRSASTSSWPRYRQSPSPRLPIHRGVIAYCWACLAANKWRVPLIPDASRSAPFSTLEREPAYTEKPGTHRCIIPCPPPRRMQRTSPSVSTRSRSARPSPPHTLPVGVLARCTVRIPCSCNKLQPEAVLCPARTCPASVLRPPFPPNIHSFCCLTRCRLVQLLGEAAKGMPAADPNDPRRVVITELRYVCSLPDNREGCCPYSAPRPGERARRLWEAALIQCFPAFTGWE